MKIRVRPSLGFPLGDSWLGIAAFCMLLQLAVTVSLLPQWNSEDLKDLPASYFASAVGAFIPVALVIWLAPQLPRRTAIRLPLLIALVPLAALAGAWIASLCLDLLGVEPDVTPWLIQAITKSALPALVAVLGEFQLMRDNARLAVNEEAVRALDLQGLLAGARLKLLQAQIEPHFIFNSLANVRRLSRIDSEAGRGLLADLLKYLEGALPHMREEMSTVAREIELTRAFLAIHKVRMGQRLRTRFVVAPASMDSFVPSMLVLTLVENALKHGIGPLPEGGEIVITVEPADDNRIRLVVSDSGRGLSPSSGNGVGLANVRARLRSHYGDAGSLSLQLNEPRGVIASIVIPGQRR